MAANGLRVLLVNDIGRPSGGAELQMLAIRDGLRARGHIVRLLASDAALVPGYPLLADRTCRGHTNLAQVVTQTANVDARRVLAAELAEFPPDVVHVRMFLWQLSPLILPLLRDVPVLLQAAVYKEICPNGLKLRPDGSVCGTPAGMVCLTSGCIRWKTWASTMTQLGLVRRWRSSIDVVSALSQRMASAYEAEGWGEVRVLPNGVDARPMRPPLGPRPVAAYAGRLSREKGVDVLLDAFAAVADRVPEARLLIAGAGPLEDALRSKAAPLGDRVEFLGHLSRDDMETRFAEAWVQVVPSIWHEPFGNVTTEAMMRGTAVIASDVGGQSDIARDGQTGYLVPPGDAASLSAALGRVLGDQGLAERLGQEGRRVAIEDYSRDRNTDMVEEAYRDTIAAFRRKGRARPDAL